MDTSYNHQARKKVLAQLVKEKQQKQSLQENKKAIEEYNQHIEKKESSATTYEASNDTVHALPQQKQRQQ